MRTAWATLLLLLLVLVVGGGLGVPARQQDRDRGLLVPGSEPADAAEPAWPGLWGVLRAIRDTTTSTRTRSDAAADAANRTAVAVLDAPAATVAPQRTSTLGQVTKQVTDRVANVLQSMRSSLWQLTAGALLGGEAVATTTTTTTLPPPADLEAGASSDVLGKEAADVREPADVAAAALRLQDKQQSKQEEPQGFISSAIERVRGAGRTFTEVGRTVGRWGKAMADSVVGTTVNSAVGTVLQVFKGGKQDDDADHVCFPDLGCFSLLEPWSSSKRPLPRMNAPEDVQTRFFLHNRNATAEPIALVPANETVANATALLKGARTFFVVHGFNDKTTAAWVQELKDILLLKLDCNVVLVDWAPGAMAARNYLQAASNTRIVGAEIARLVEALDRSELLPMDTLHVIGHSLGAHAAGYAGKQLGGRLGRITALDAAQPAFEDQAPEVRVAVGDALFVDVLHTNGVPFIPTLGLGVMHPVGDVDFYLNGGTVQPGCFVPKLPAVASLMDLAALPVSVLGDMLSCSHRRAIEYFIESIRSDCLMWGRRRAEDDLDAEGDGDKRTPVTVEGSPHSGSRKRQTQPSSSSSSSWWAPSGGLGGLLAGLWSGDSKDSKAPPTEAPPSTTGPGRPAAAGKGFAFSFPFFGVFSTEPRRPAAAPATANKSALIVKDRDKEVRPVDSNGIAADAGGNKGGKREAGDAGGAAGDSLPAQSAAHSSRSRSRPRGPVPPPPPPPAWCEEDCLPLGLDADRYQLRGTFNVLTADHSPYCMSQESNEVE